MLYKYNNAHYILDTLYLYWLLYVTCNLIYDRSIDSAILLSRSKKKKKRHIWENCFFWSNSNLTVFKTGNISNFDTTCYTTGVCLQRVHRPSYTPPLYPWLKSEARLTRRKVGWKQDGWYRFVGIRQLFHSRYYRRNWIPFAVICLRFGGR